MSGFVFNEQTKLESARWLFFIIKNMTTQEEILNCVALTAHDANVYSRDWADSV